MQLRALIELSGYCETRNQFLHRTVNKIIAHHILIAGLIRILSAFVACMQCVL